MSNYHHHALLICLLRLIFQQLTQFEPLLVQKHPSHPTKIIEPNHSKIGVTKKWETQKTTPSLMQKTASLGGGQQNIKLGE